MTTLDWIIVALYFVGMAGVGIWAMRRVHTQDDFFMGGRGFGKLMQTFAAFGAGTGSADPINTARTTFTSGLSGMWSVMYWLFVTPVYWIAGVWRHTTLGDWFHERYESRPLAAAYALFGVLFYIVYTAMLFSAISKFTLPLLQTDAVTLGGAVFQMKYVLVPIIGVIVIIYGVLGGLRAAYITDLVQGIFIILLSLLLLPFGLNALVEQFGDPATQGMMDGFTILHEQLPPEHFAIVGATSASEFPLYRIIAVVIINMVGIVVVPHFIATGGGTAKTEFDARVGVVSGNFIKRFCTVGWALTAMIALALFADSPILASDPDQVWGLASRELLGPGLLGLMLACLLAALMSSVDCYMLVTSALIVRNLYVPYIKPDATEEQCLKVARVVAGIIVIGAIIVSWTMMDVFKQLQLTWIVPLLFAAPFWLGLYWRRATTKAAWVTVCFSAALFFVIPWTVPVVAPGLRTSETFTATTNIVETTTTRAAAPSDVRRSEAALAVWQGKVDNNADAGAKPKVLALGDSITATTKTGGKAIFWGGAVKPVSDPAFTVISDESVGTTTTVVKQYACKLKAEGNFRPDYILYHVLGVDLKSKSNAILAALDLPVKIVTPFLVMIFFSLVTTRNSKEGLDRYYAKMHTPVNPDPEEDVKALEASYADPGQFNDGMVVPNSDIEIMKPTKVDVIGFVLCWVVCFGVIGLLIFVAGIGA
jgi:SSS family solute:Na+ symporter